MSCKFTCACRRMAHPGGVRDLRLGMCGALALRQHRQPSSGSAWEGDGLGCHPGNPAGRLRPRLGPVGWAVRTQCRLTVASRLA